MDDLRRAIRPPRIYAGLAELLIVVFVLGQLIDVIPYDNMIRDEIIFDVATAGGAAFFLVLAVVSWRRKKREAMKDREAGQPTCSPKEEMKKTIIRIALMVAMLTLVWGLLLLLGRVLHPQL